jgi:catechol 2,3-dioxygenase-like lactoylglutathione lyase family enzyme
MVTVGKVVLRVALTDSIDKVHCLFVHSCTLNEGAGVDESMPKVERADPSLPGTLELGAFSVSLNVADVDVSKSFYEKLGFVVAGGDSDHGYLILKNGESTIGIFTGMFEGNILTFNPGLTGRMETIHHFTDVRSIEEHLTGNGVELTQGTDPESPSGPAHITLVDPDGNQILIDQFF